MKKKFLALLLILPACAVFSQDKVTAELKDLTDNEEYDKIITHYADLSPQLSAQALYYVGHAYYMQEQDDNCIRFMNLSLAKDPNDAAAHFIKGSTLNYMKKYSEATACFKEAIRLKPNVPKHYSGLGDAWYNLDKTDRALEAYKNAQTLPECPDRPYVMVAQIYSEQDNNEQALKAYYAAKDYIAKQSDSYLNVLFNIGLLEMLKGEYDKAEPEFLALLKLDPKDYHANAKLIQVYYHRQDYDRAQPYKDSLYAASRRGELEGNLKNMFCIDQFKWNGRQIQAYERYEDGDKDDIYNKHLFYILDHKGEIDFRMQTEYSPYASEIAGSPRYMLCANKGDAHHNYGLVFTKGYTYGALKKVVIEVLEKDTKPAAKTTPGR